MRVVGRSLQRPNLAVRIVRWRELLRGRPTERGRGIIQLSILLAVVAITATFPGIPSSTAHAPHAGNAAIRSAWGRGLDSLGSSDATVTVQPSTGLVGTRLNVSGSGFLANANITIYFNGTGESVIVPTVPTPCVSNSSGNFTCFTRVPALPAGVYDVNLTDNVTNASASFPILPPVLLVSPDSGYVMSNVTANGSGFAPGVDVTLLFNSTSIPSANCTSGSSLWVDEGGNFTCTFATPVHSAGVVPVSATDGINTGTTSFTVLRPTLALNRSSGFVDSTVIASGTGYVHGVTVTLIFGSHTLTSCVAGSIDANGSGSFNCTFKVPTLPSGHYHVKANDSVNSAPSVVFTIGPPLLNLSPARGFVGNSTTATGIGFGHSTYVTLAFGPTLIHTSDCIAGSLATGHSGTFSCTFLVPPSTAGNQSVRANDSVNSVSENYTVVPHLALSQPNGSYGDEVTVTATGFDGIASISVAWNSSDVLCTGTTGSNGSFSCSFLVPSAPAGSHTVKASEGLNVVPASFQVIPSATLSASSQIVGYTLTASGYGFNPSASISILWRHVTPECVGAVTDVNGAVICAFAVPGAPGGTHNVTFVQGTLEVNVSFTVLLWFSIAPSAGVVGTSIGLFGTGFQASTAYLSCLQTTPEYCPTGTSFTTQSNGTIPPGTEFTVPSEPQGQYYLVVSVGTSIADAKAFNVTSAIVSPSPAFGPVGISITLTGGNFVPYANYTYCFQAQASACPSGVRTGFEATGSGTIPSGTPPLEVPAEPAGSYYVDVSNQTNLIGVHTFTVVSNLTGSVTLGTVGTAVTATGTGFAASAAYSLVWNASVRLCSGATSSLGGFTCQFVIPFAVAGSHQLNATAAGTMANFTLSILPHLELSPTSGTVGSTVHATGSGFNGLASFALDWNTSVASCLGKTNFSGGFACSFVVPYAPAGAHDLEAAEGVLTNLSSFVVLPSLAPAPGTGPVGSTAELTGQGFAASASYTVLWNGSTVLCSGSTNVSGVFACGFIVPVSPGGATTILAVQVPNSITTEFTVTPSVSVSPNEGTVGSRIQAVAQGLVSGSAYTLAWNSSTSVCAGSASSAGEYFCNFTVPIAPAGTRDLAGSDGALPFSVEFVVIPSSSISQSSGTVNSTVHIVGEGFDAGAPYSVSWNASTMVCSGVTQSNGNLSCTFVVPSNPGGLHLVKITEGTFVLTSSFTIDPSLSVSPRSWTVGSVATVSGFGFAAVTGYAVSWSAGAVLCTGSTDANGAFACSFTVPSVAPGNYTITGVQGGNTPTVTISVSSSAPAPSHSTTTTPFPWWIVAVVVVAGLAASLAIYYRYGRRPSRGPRPVKPWDESGLMSVPTTTAAGPGPLESTYAAGASGLAAGTVAGQGAPPVPPTPPEDVDALIARLDRIAEQMFKRKSGPELEQDQGVGTAEGSAEEAQ